MLHPTRKLFCFYCCALAIGLASILLAIVVIPRHLVLAASTLSEEFPYDNRTQNLLLHVEPSLTPDERARVVAAIGGELVTWMPQIGVVEVRVAVQSAGYAADLPQMAEMIAQGVVQHVEADGVVTAAYMPTDPDFGDATMRYGLDHVDALEAWDIITGSQSIVIAVIDSGVHLEHPEFAGRLVAGYDFVDNDATANDLSGHGTHVAGIVAAALDNGEGLAGVCPNCRLMPVKVLNQYSHGSWSQLAQGILFAVDNGARIINLSLGGTVPSQTVASAVDYALQSGVVIIAAAGNFASDKPYYPAALEGVIAVGATTSKSERWAKSDFGAYVDLVAPGDVIYSTYHKQDNAFRGYTYMSGTSMAAPFVSGVAGLLLSVAPTLSADDVREALMLGVDDLGSAGRDDHFGEGRVNAMGALLSPVEGLVEAVGEITNPNQRPVVYLPTVSTQ